ncbi:peroxide stress protein YaaA [Litorimonas haliclonae]|uniref:peroxide stress protein YaaA n=1 Tax=Litorimonas haliclonae TaxID=2081977 RepID=UPI0039EF927E
MITLLSPAKKLNENPAETGLEITRPRFEDETRELAQVAKKQSVADLKKLMHLSDNLAELNVDRFRSFNLDGQSNSAQPAGLTFDGDVYWGLEAKSLSDDDLDYAQTHLRILSGLYGVLRPMDAIQPYRLEMGTKLKTKRGKSLYEFWDTKLAEQLREDLNGHHDHTIVNLASNEYFKAVDKETLDKPVIEAKFLNIKDGETRHLMYYAKFGRGLMARWIMQNRIDKAEDLKAFDLENYKFDKSLSSETELVFTRPQPPKKS